MIQLDNAGTEEEFPEPHGIKLLVDIAAIIGCGVFTMFAVFGAAVAVMALSR